MSARLGSPMSLSSSPLHGLISTSRLIQTAESSHTSTPRALPCRALPRCVSDTVWTAGNSETSNPLVLNILPYFIQPSPLVRSLSWWPSRLSRVTWSSSWMSSPLRKGKKAMMRKRRQQTHSLGCLARWHVSLKSGTTFGRTYWLYR